MIHLQGLTKYYGPRAAIEDVSFQVGKGETLGLLGPNGAGKTTALRIITGLLPPTRGTATVAGFDVMTHPVEAKRHIGYLPENVALYTDMTVSGYLSFVAELRGYRGKVLRLRVSRALEIGNLDLVANTIIGKLSKGYRQRVGLAQALLHEPDVLILDEPTVGLDPKQIIETRELIRSLAGEQSIILSTHILPEVTLTCQRVVIINEGRVVAEDTPQSLSQRLHGAERVRLEVRGPVDEVAAKLLQTPGVLGVQSTASSLEGVGIHLVDCELGMDARERLADLVVRSDWGLLELRAEGVSLEEVFLRLTTREEAV